jgi:hypothetical protein
MKKIAVFILLFLSVSFAKKLLGQPNLVPNHSFEDTIMPVQPPAFYLENFIHNWQGGHGYYRTTRIGNFSVPSNYLGYQYPKSGNAYCGITTRGNGTIPAREYIQTKLIQNLTLGIKYKVSFYVSLADTFNSYSNSIGAYFSADSFFVSMFGLVEQIPQIQNSIHNDLGSKSNWTLVCDTFTAIGTERYITIGNFYTDSLCPLTHLTNICEQQPSSWGCGAYYYIDDVSVELVDETGIEEQKQNIYNLYPNPNNGNFALNCISNETLLCEITDFTGRIILSKSFKPINGSVSFNNLSISKGIYSLRVLSISGDHVILRVVIK